MFYINISIYASFKYLFYKTKNHLVIRQCLVEETIFLNKDIIGLKSKIVQFQLSQLILFNTNFFASSTKIATLHCQFVIHMTQCLGNAFLKHYLFSKSCLLHFVQNISHQCVEKIRYHNRDLDAKQTVLQNIATQLNFLIFHEKQSFGLTVQILNQRYFYRSLHKYYSFSNLHQVLACNECVGAPPSNDALPLKHCCVSNIFRAKNYYFDTCLM